MPLNHYVTLGNSGLRVSPLCLGAMTFGEEWLRRLQTDYIDLYWLHVLDLMTPMDETLRALDQLVQQGKVRYLGFSDVPAWKAAQAQVTAQLRGWTPLIALQIEYSLPERT